MMNTENNEKVKNPCRDQGGFSLIELMIVVTIIAILATIAFPGYQASVRKSRRADAQGALIVFAATMERHFTEHNTYEGAATKEGGKIPAIFATEAPLGGTDKFYDLTIQAAGATAYTLRATPKNAQKGDGFIELTSTGVRRWDENNDGSTDDAEQDWKQG